MATSWSRKIPITLADTKAKAARAKVHLNSLQDELRRFRKAKPYTVIIKKDSKGGRYLVRVKIRRLPARIHLIVGEFLYCMRSALDQLVYSLAKLSKPLPNGTQFPVFSYDIAKDKKLNARFKAQTSGVPAAAVTIIESLQPYHGGNPVAIQSNLLWRLNALCNIDKHRRIPVNGTVGILNFPNLPRSLGPLIKFHRHNVVSIPTTTKRHVRPDSRASFNVVFGDLSEGISCDLDGLRDIHNYVAKDVIPRFARFFK